jgi:hypothetical protein
MLETEIIAGKVVGYREQDRYLPINNIQRCACLYRLKLMPSGPAEIMVCYPRLMKRALPESSKIAKETKGVLGRIYIDQGLTVMLLRRMYTRGYFRVHQLHHLRSCRQSYEREAQDNHWR